MGFNLGNTLFGGNANPPEYHPPELSKDTNEAIGRTNNMANESRDQISRELMSGVAGTGKGLLSTGNSIGESEAALGMTSSGANREALAARGQRIYGNELNQTERQAPMQAHEMQMQRLQQAQQVLHARDQFKLGVAKASMQHLLDQNQARMGVMNEIIHGGALAAGYGMAQMKKKGEDSSLDDFYANTEDENGEAL